MLGGVLGCAVKRVGRQGCSKKGYCENDKCLLHWIWWKRPIRSIVSIQLPALSAEWPRVLPRPRHAPAGVMVQVPLGVARTSGLVRRFTHFAGIDRAVAYTVAGRMWALLSGLVSAFVIVAFLSPVQQGYWYTFGSILGLQVFFELGLTMVILQFAAHEKAHLEWNGGRLLEGSETAKRRLASLLRLALKWYAVAGVLTICLILPVGWLLFSQKQVEENVAWQTPWLLLSVITAVSLFVSPIYAILEGCGRIREVAVFRTGQAIVGSLVVWLALALQINLYAVPLTSLATLTMGIAWLVVRYRGWFLDLIGTDVEEAGIHWWSEVWPFQWKIAVSWLGGYFVFQLFTPILFANSGAVVAGQMGMSISLAGAVGAMAMAWINTKAPFFGGFVARGDWSALDRLFFRTLRQSFAAVVVGATGAFGFVVMLRVAGLPVGERVLPLPALAVLLATTVVNQIVFSEAVYLRAHKQEPFMLLSVVNGASIGLATYVLGRLFGAMGMVVGSLVLTTVIGLGWGTWIFRKKRREWHFG